MGGCACNCSKLGRKQSIGATLGNLGLAYFSLGDYRKAIDYHEKALAIAVEIGDKKAREIISATLEMHTSI